VWYLNLPEFCHVYWFFMKHWIIFIFKYFDFGQLHAFAYVSMRLTHANVCWTHTHVCSCACFIWGLNRFSVFQWLWIWSIHFTSLVFALAKECSGPISKHTKTRTIFEFSLFSFSSWIEFQAPFLFCLFKKSSLQ
jgi:hypothetical protein